MAQDLLGVKTGGHFTLLIGVMHDYIYIYLINCIYIYILYISPATTGDGAYLVGWGNNFLGNDATSLTYYM